MDPPPPLPPSNFMQLRLPPGRRLVAMQLTARIVTEDDEADGPQAQRRIFAYEAEHSYGATSSDGKLQVAAELHVRRADVG